MLRKLLCYGRYLERHKVNCIWLGVCVSADETWRMLGWECICVCVRVYTAINRESTSQSTHRVATAAFWRTFHHDGKISPGW